MEYILTPYSRKINNLAWWDNVFTPEELTWLQDKAKLADEKAEVGSIEKPRNDLELRRSNIYWLYNNKESLWVYKRLAHIISYINSDVFNYDLSGFAEAIQLTNYDSIDKGAYGWHIDSTEFGPCRKLSLTVQLSEPSDYEGGVLEIADSEKIIQIPKKRGYVSFFPSFIKHQVTPVTTGSRQSLVVWISGPPFR